MSILAVLKVAHHKLPTPIVDPTMSYPCCLIACWLIIEVGCSFAAGAMLAGCLLPLQCSSQGWVRGTPKIDNCGICPPMVVGLSPCDVDC